MAEPEAEAAWRAELERIGETQPREAGARSLMPSDLVDR